MFFDPIPNAAFHVHLSGAFQTAYITLRRALQSEDNHGHHIEELFQTELLKTGHLKGILE